MVHYRALSLDVKKAASEDVDERPTLVIAPSSVIGEWFRELTKFFNGILQFDNFYSFETEKWEPQLRDHVLLSDPLLVRQKISAISKQLQILGLSNLTRIANHRPAATKVGGVHHPGCLEDHRASEAQKSDSACRRSEAQKGREGRTSVVRKALSPTARVALLVSLCKNPPFRGGVPLWLLKPKPFATLANKNLLSRPDVAARVLRAIITRVQLKWTMASVIQLDDDTVYKPGVNVPMYHISGVELRQSKYKAAQYKKIWDIFAPFLNRAGGRPGKPSKKLGINNATSRDMALHRSMSISAFDLRFFVLLLHMVQHGASEVAL
ncbi:hypothetical protein LTR72_010150 [Exophiala xenobiotica]|nr:hypothetical protein LTR72_010150 [Exophiala xenobiotica]KAK5286842.1 hypothetical protein LTR14_009587 [Exophiala xenobiotica]KAK5478047.1 hypothetical protein LTR55_008031 [Exophiala xenobiotica]